MEEVQENTIQEPTKKQTIYSPEMKMNLLNEYNNMIGKITMSQFIKNQELSVSTVS